MNTNFYSLRTVSNRSAFLRGMQDAIPIGLGYLAVSFSLGIAARNIGLSPVQSFFMSLLNNASAGEYAGLTMIAAEGTYLEMAMITLIANARYLLMSCAMSQRVSPDISIPHRMLVAFDITDELFGIAIARPRYLNPNYTYGAVVVAAPSWAIGTAIGCITGNLMPERMVSAFSVALFGMFLAIIIPPARADKVVGALVGISFLASAVTSWLPLFARISGGMRTIILTAAISAAAAVLFPREPEEEEKGQ